MNPDASSAMVFNIGPMEDVDVAAITCFVAKIPLHDLLFLDRDLREPKVLAAWRDGIGSGFIHSLVAVADGNVIATTAVIRDPLSWSAHVAEMRLLVLPEWRGKGVGRKLLEASIERAVADGAVKLTARMTPDQQGAITLFEETGFRGEALLRDHVRGPDGEAHDLAILSLDVVASEARRRALEG